MRIYKMKPCKECGKDFQPTASRNWYCSLRCRVLAQTIIIPNSCWLWCSGHSGRGYGLIYDEGRRVYSHRAAFQVWNGPIPPGLFVLHHCDNPPCVNPVHLFLGTQAENMADMKTKGRDAKGEKHGHTALLPEQVRQIRTATGKQKDIAARYGITDSAVRHIKSRRRWAHLED